MAAAPQAEPPGSEGLETSERESQHATQLPDARRGGRGRIGRHLRSPRWGAWRRAPAPQARVEARSGRAAVRLQRLAAGAPQLPQLQRVPVTCEEQALRQREGREAQPSPCPPGLPLWRQARTQAEPGEVAGPVPSWRQEAGHGGQARPPCAPDPGLLSPAASAWWAG